MSILFLYVQIRFLGSLHFQKKLLGPQIAGYRDFPVHLRPIIEDQNEMLAMMNDFKTSSTN